MFLFLAIAFPLHADKDFWRLFDFIKRPVTLAGEFEISEIKYNRILQPQFYRDEIAASMQLLNGGLGRGDSLSYFCSGQDERDFFRRLRGISNWQGANPESGWHNEAPYRLMRQEDRCRTEGGCGELEPDGKFFIIGIPHHATNCHPWGGMRSWDEEIFTYSTPPDVTSVLDDPGHEAWQGRNYIDDGHDFLYGRYFIYQLMPDRPGERLDGDDLLNAARRHMRVETGRGDPYRIESPRPQPYLDIPYSVDHLTWGYTCAQILRTNGYGRRSSIFGGRGPLKEISEDEAGRERREHYKTLLEHAAGSLGARIASGGFGDLSPAGRKLLTPLEKEMSEVVVNIWSILDRMLKRLRAPCSWWGCRIWEAVRNILGGSRITLSRCRVPGGSLVDYQDEKSRICIRPDIFSDCHSKRAFGSHPHYNVEGMEEGSECVPSYGERLEGGLYERVWQEDRGYQLRDRGSSMGAIRGLSGYRPASGYSPVIASLIAHQFIHAYFLERLGIDRMAGWPARPEALWEEELAVMAQAVIYSELRVLGYAPSSFRMERESFVRSIERATPGNTSTPVVEIEGGYRYLYPTVCRGYGGIFLGPFCSNMQNTYESLRVWKPETARMMALYHSLGPMMEMPSLMTVDGEESLVQGASDVEVELSLDEDQIFIGETTVLTATLTNHGPDNTRFISLRYNLPREISFAGLDVEREDCHYNAAERILGCHIDSMRAGETTVVFSMTVMGVAEGTVVNHVTVVSAASDPNPENDSAEVNLEVRRPAADKDAAERGGGP